MNKKRFIMGIILFVLVLCTFLLLRGNGISKNEKKLLKRIEVQKWEIEETATGVILRASVKMPDYGTYLVESYKDAQKGLFANEEKFEKKLYKTADKKAKKEKDTVGKSIIVNLAKLDEKVNIKSKKKIEEFIKEYALEKELEELSVEILNEGFKEIMCGEAEE